MDKSQVEHIKALSDIVAVISEYVELRKKGRNLWGLCPFHSEKTPSFSVDPDKQIYKCFGCDKGGDVFSFVMEKKGLSFAEALAELARRAGVALEPPKSQAASERKVFYDANRAAMAFFEQQLSSPQGERARRYLAGRGLSDDTVKAFHLGFAPDSWDSLVAHLRGRGIPAQAAERCGLIAARKTGGYYDRFRNRVMFPIIDLSGEVIAFGGRIMEAGEPKYLNSPESPVFEKKRVLYNLHSARATLRQRGAVVVEGYMDVISLANAGFTGAVATLGTALGDEHIRILRRFTEDITLVFDGDSAGRNAMVRALDPFLASGIVPKVVILPQGKDPDDMARQDIASFTGLVAQAQDIWELIFDESFSRHDPSKLRGLNGIVKELAPMFARLHDHVLRDLLVQRLAVRLGISPEVIMKGMNPAFVAPDQVAPAPAHGERHALETTLARLLLQEPAAAELVREQGMTFEFQEPGLRVLFDHLFRHGVQACDGPGCPDRVRLEASRLRALGDFPGDVKKALIDTVCRFKSLAIDEELRRIQGELHLAEKSADKARRNELLRAKQDLAVLKKGLRSHVMEAFEKR